MKVIRLNEVDEADLVQTPSGLFVQRSAVQNNQQDTSDSTPDKPEYTNVDVNSIKNDFELNIGKTVSEKEVRDHLNKFFEKVGKYGNNDASNVGKVLSKFDFKFIKYFLECLNYGNLGNKSNVILTALANDSAQTMLNGNKNTFTKLFNLLNNNERDIPLDYLSDKNALIFNRSLFNLYDAETVEAVILNDIAHKGDKNWRKSVESNILSGNIDQFKTKETRQYREIQSAVDTFRKLDAKEATNALTSLGVDQRVAQTAAGQINHEANN